MTRALWVSIVVVILACGGCTGGEEEPPEPMRVIAYGHSWPLGYRVDRSYPERVAAQLDMPLVNWAHSGDLSAATAARAQLHPPRRRDTVLVQTGLNDARGYGMAGLAIYEESLKGILLTVTRAETVVLVIDQLVPGWQGGAPYNLGSPEVMSAYAQVTATVASDFDNVTVLLPELDPASDFQADGVHPDEAGHRALASAVLKALARR
jgi:lysophospholipase L1-like esterase